MSWPAAALDILLLAAASLGLPLWSFFAGRGYARRRRSEGTLAKTYWLIAARSAALSVLVILAWSMAHRPFSMLGLDAPVGLPGRVGFIIDVAIIGYYLARVPFSRRSGVQLAATRDRLRRLGSYDMLPQSSAEFAIYPVAAIAGSTCEELLYRGYLIGVLSPLIGMPGAVVCSSALFGMGHVYQGWIGIVRTAVIGLVFGVAFALTHSLWWLMIAHSTANLSGIFLARRILAEAPESMPG